MSNKKVNVGIVGLGFGKEFIPIYQKHPNGGKIAICTRTPATLNEVGDQFNIPAELRYTDYYKMIENEELDAIHIVTPILEHYKQTIAALEKGKHTACTVPMATSIEECQHIVRCQQENRQILYDDGNLLIYPGVPVCEKTEFRRQIRENPVCSKRPSSKHDFGRLG